MEYFPSFVEHDTVEMTSFLWVYISRLHEGKNKNNNNNKIKHYKTEIYNLNRIKKVLFFWGKNRIFKHAQ